MRDYCDLRSVPFFYLLLLVLHPFLRFVLLLLVLLVLPVLLVLLVLLVLQVLLLVLLLVRLLVLLFMSPVNSRQIAAKLRSLVSFEV